MLFSICSRRQTSQAFLLVINTLAPCNSQEVFMEKTIHKPYATKEPERPKRGLHRLFGGLQKKKRPDQQKGNA